MVGTCFRSPGMFSNLTCLFEYPRMFSNLTPMFSKRIVFNPFVRIYTHEIPKPLRLLYVYIYVHGLYDRNLGLLPASNRHFTVSPHELFMCFRSVASISQHVYQVGRKGVCSELSAVFGEFWKITIVGPN